MQCHVINDALIPGQTAQFFAVCRIDHRQAEALVSQSAAEQIQSVSTDFHFTKNDERYFSFIALLHSLRSQAAQFLFVENIDPLSIRTEHHNRLGIREWDELFLRFHRREIFRLIISIKQWIIVRIH